MQQASKQQLLPRKRSMDDEIAVAVGEQPLNDRNVARNCSGHGQGSPRAQQQQLLLLEQQQTQQQQQQQQGLVAVDECDSLLADDMSDLAGLLDELTSVGGDIEL
jgi:hypothetical protein